MRRISRSRVQIAVALALLALFAAPVARATLELDAGDHSCCPREPAPPLDERGPCQQIAATSCCLEIAVPPIPHGDEGLSAPLLALGSSPVSPPPAPAFQLGAVLTRSDGPPLAPLAKSGVLLL